MSLDLISVKNQLYAIFSNILSWLFHFIRLTRDSKLKLQNDKDYCVYIPAPGGLEKLKELKLGDNEENIASVGYNVPSFPPPFVKTKLFDIESDPTLVLVTVEYFSINYADICIRWGLYESALRYVGWPIVPGFDFSGTVAVAGSSSGYEVGDRVFGFTLFGAYSRKLLVPARQIRKVSPRSTIPMETYAAFAAVAATALHSLALAGGWPSTPVTKNRAALVHSAAGGVGTMLLQMLKHRGYHPHRSRSVKR